MVGALTGWKLLCPEVSEYRQYISDMRTNDWGSIGYRLLCPEVSGYRQNILI
jgi:hypothetical protein